MNQIIKSIKRNPIILAATAVIVLQVIEDWGSFTSKDWFQNLFTMAIAFMAREFTVPAKENEQLKESVSKAIVNLEAQKQKELQDWSLRLGVVPIEWHDKAVLKAMKDARELALDQANEDSSKFKEGGYK